MTNPFERKLVPRPEKPKGKGGEERRKERRKEESLEENLAEKRSAYITADTEYRQAFGKMKKKDLKRFEKTIKLAKEYIKPGDSEILKDPKSPKYSEAIRRKADFIEELGKAKIEEEKAEAIYNAALKRAEAETEYYNVKKELGKQLLAEGETDVKIFQKLILEEREFLDRAKIEDWPPKEKGSFKKVLDWWMQRGPATRLLISTGLVAGAVAVTGGYSAPAIALFAGQRYVRGMGAVLVAKLAGKGVDWAMEKRIKAKEEAALSKLKEGFSLEKLREVDTKYRKILEESIGKRQKKLVVKALVTLATGFGASLSLRMLESYWEAETAEVPTRGGAVTPGEVKAPIILEIGRRGPEGAIIDYFKANPEAAKSFGWDGKSNFADWAGKKAHLLWLQEAKKALDKQETLAQLKELGYSQNLEGYAQMMRRIGKGFVKLDPENGKMDLVDMKYLKVRVPTEAPAEVSQKAPPPIPPETPPEPPPLPPIPSEPPPPPVMPPGPPPELPPVPEKPPSDITDTVVKLIGFDRREYNAIKDITVEKLLKEIPPSKEEALAIWRGDIKGKSINLPHAGIYGIGEFNKHFRLAEFIRDSNPEPEQLRSILKLKIGTYLKNYTGKVELK